MSHLAEPSPCLHVLFAGGLLSGISREARVVFYCEKLGPEKKIHQKELEWNSRQNNGVLAIVEKIEVLVQSVKRQTA